MIIYAIRNSLNPKVYIGQTTIPLKQRWASHCHMALNGTSKRIPRIHRAMRRHGVDHFRIEVIETLPEGSSLDDLDAREIFWIKHFRSLSDGAYNQHDGGNRRGPVSDETRQKLSEALKGRRRTAAQKERNSESHLGLKHSEETKRRMSIAATGHIKSEEHRANLSKALSGKPLSEEHRKKLSLAKIGKPGARSKAVECIETQRIFISAIEASRQLGIPRPSITCVCLGTQKTAGGYTFRFAPESKKEREG